jgi:hypothetical protein
MSFDNSRFSFQPWNDFLGVVMQQGRVQLDSDWNELVAQLTRRIQAGNLDTFGEAVVPRETDKGKGFQITLINSPSKDLTIDAGRIYVDGLLAENHGNPDKLLEWDAKLAELKGTAPVSFFHQPYLLFNKDKVSEADYGAIFNSPVLLEGRPYLVYVDVWQREVTALQKPDLIEKAIGVETTGRLQMVWQVKVHELINSENLDCSTAKQDVEWQKKIRPSGARLTTSLDNKTSDSGPCVVPLASGYQGLENQLYRVEIHNSSSATGGPTFKWSRDNATVASRVSQILTLTQIVVEHVKRDDVLGFHGGDWIEILDDRHELHGQPGILRQIKSGGVNENSNTLTLETALPDGLFSVDANTGEWNTRVRRWDQSGVVRQSDGTAYYDLNGTGGYSGIPIKASGAGIKLFLENGILVEFALEQNLEFKTGDYWVFAARTVDGKIEELDKAPPQGIHHHYACLAVVKFPDINHNCRTLWPTVIEGGSCDCTVCVSVETHNSGKATIQHAIDSVRERGGTICLEAGTYIIQKETPIKIESMKSIRIQGQGSNTLLLGSEMEVVINIDNSQGVYLQNFSAINSFGETDQPHLMVMAAKTERVVDSAVIKVSNTIDFSLDHVNAFYLPFQSAKVSRKNSLVATGTSAVYGAAIALSGLIFGASIRSCTLWALQGVVFINVQRFREAGTAPRNAYLFSSDLRIQDNFISCFLRGISFDGASLHYGNFLISNNLFMGCYDVGIELTGGALTGSSVVIEKNVLNISGTGIQCGLDGMRLIDNEIAAVGASLPSRGHGIVIEGGIGHELEINPEVADNLQIIGNRIHDSKGNGIVIRKKIGHGMIKSNVVERIVGSGLIIEDAGSADYLSIENNHFLDIGVNNSSPDGGTNLYVAIQLKDVQSSDIVCNMIDRVDKRGNFNTSVGLLIIACDDLRIAGNRLQNVKSTRSVGIECVSPFQNIAIHDNTILSADNNDQFWTALYIGSGRNDNNFENIQMSTVRGINTIFANKQALAFNEKGIRSLNNQLGSSGIHRNRFMANMSSDTLIRIHNAATCLFTENYCEMTRESRQPLVEISGIQINASNNQLIGGDSNIQLSINPTRNNNRDRPKNIVVLGNLTTGPIFVNNQPLGVPWAELNQTQP